MQSRPSRPTIRPVNLPLQPPPPGDDALGSPASRVAALLAWVALGVILASFLLRAGISVRQYAQTVDETYHAGAAVSYLHARTLVLGVQHPPLGRLPAAVAAWLLGGELPDYDNATTSRREDVAYAAGTELLHGRDPTWYWRLLTAMRLAMLAFGAITLLYAFLLGRWLAGPLAGVGAALLLSLDTTLLGHAYWICTDVAAAAGFLAALYHGLRWVERPTWPRAVAAGLAGGLAVSLKFTAALALPALLAAMVIVGLARAWGVHVAAPGTGRLSPADLTGNLAQRTLTLAGEWAAALLKRGVQLPFILLLALLVLWGTYKFHIGPLADSDTLASAPQWNQLSPEVKNTPVPMPSFWIGLGRLAAHSATGSDAYLLGEKRNGGFWYYFPVLLVFKTPVSLLLLLVASVILAFEAKARSVLVLAGLIVPAGLYLAVSMAGGVQIGIRHVLPLLAVLYVLAGVVFTRTRLRSAIVVLAAVLAAVETLPRHPDYLAFFNLLARTNGQHERIAADSNLDWGQDLRRLAAHVKRNERLRRELSAVYPLGDRQTPLFMTLGLDPNLIDAPPRPGSIVAVSISRRILDPERFRFLDAATEVDRVGRGIVVYRLPATRPPSTGP